MLLVRDISFLEQWVRDENNKSLAWVFTMFPDMGRKKKTAISIVLQILETISDCDLLDSQIPNAGWFSHFLLLFLQLLDIIL